jgi:hypothetical protein
VSIDLASQRLGPALERAGFDRQTVTTWVWEGAVSYLTGEQVRATVAQIAELSAPDSQLVVNYQTKSLPTTVMRAADFSPLDFPQRFAATVNGVQIRGEWQTGEGDGWSRDFAPVCRPRWPAHWPIRMSGQTSHATVGEVEVKGILAKVSQGRPVENFETICTRRDGTAFPVKVTLTPIRDAGGTIVGASAIARDVYAIARDMPEQG